VQAKKFFPHVHYGRVEEKSRAAMIRKQGKKRDMTRGAKEKQGTNNPIHRNVKEITLNTKGGNWHCTEKKGGERRGAQCIEDLRREGC